MIFCLCRPKIVVKIKHFRIFVCHWTYAVVYFTVLSCATLCCVCVCFYVYVWNVRKERFQCHLCKTPFSIELRSLNRWHCRKTPLSMQNNGWMKGDDVSCIIDKDSTNGALFLSLTLSMLPCRQFVLSAMHLAWCFNLIGI